MSRSLNTKDWLRRHLTDPYVKRAQKDGYRSRSVYKLIELDEENRLIKPGMTVVDLGAAPGGWSQVTARKVGAKGRVIAIDLLDMAAIPGVTFLKADFSEKAGLDAIVAALAGRPADLVLSDMAPNLTGITVTDQVRMFALAELALEFSHEFLRPGGDFLIKVFQGAGYPEYVKAMRLMFAKAVVKKPNASRAESNEIYLLGKGKKT
jgi:23S rRNA (uridine2552-2'-O)-methyltransferase